MARKLVIQAAFATSLVAALTPAKAATLTYATTLSGATESPNPTPSPGTGQALVTINNDNPLMPIMTVDVTFSGLLSTTTASHIHCCTTTPGMGSAIVATTTPTFPGFPLNVTFGNYDQTFDMSLAGSYNPAFVTAHGGTPLSAFAVLFAGLNADTRHTSIFTPTNFLVVRSAAS